MEVGAQETIIGEIGVGVEIGEGREVAVVVLVAIVIEVETVKQIIINNNIGIKEVAEVIKSEMTGGMIIREVVIIMKGEVMTMITIGVEIVVKLLNKTHFNNININIVV